MITSCRGFGITSLLKRRAQLPAGTLALQYGLDLLLTACADSMVGEQVIGGIWDLVGRLHACRSN